MPARLTRPDGPVPTPGIVHLGLGAFFRAFGAVWVQEAMETAGGDWGIVGVSLQSPTTRDLLKPQGCVYTALELGPQGSTPRLVTSVVDVLAAPEDPEAVLARMADPATKIVSLTVTEKGYCHDPATGRLNLDHPDIQHDLTYPLPRSAPGYLVRALQRRQAAGLPPFTVLTCDNLPRNGAVVRGVVVDLARRIDPALANWIAVEGRFPATMVDRIVPATKPEDLATVADLTGTADRAPVLHEPFRQWVIEDDFVPGTRPPLDRVGVQMVTDVTAFEHMKLRMLNGTHSSLAYLGNLAGYETIADTVADSAFAAFARHLWRNEIIPALTPPPGESLTAYAAVLLKRYENPAIRHRTWQIAMDGSQKLPQRILGTWSENNAAGRVSPGLTLAIAAWMVWVGGTDLNGRQIEVKDPLAPRLRALSDLGQTNADKVAAFLGVTEIFDPALAADLRDPVTAAYATLKSRGARAAVQEVAR